MPITFPMPNFGAILPEIIILFMACVVLVVDFAMGKEHQRTWLGYLSLQGILGAMLASLAMLIGGKSLATFGGMFLVDGFALFFKLVFLLVAALTIMISLRYLEVEEASRGEYYVLVLLATLGMMIMAAGNELLTIYIALELMSFCLYVLIGFFKRELKSIEAALKYFLVGAFSSGILLYGLALLYGLTGETALPRIAAVLAEKNLYGNPILILSMVLLIAGFGFKVSAVPFHMWAPDVYEGAPTSITAFLSVGSKAASFAALLRIFFVALGGSKANWEPLLWVLAVLTMTLGNLVAINQTNIKRLLAYSSIASAGYLLIGIVAGNEIGLASVLLYALVYGFMNIGCFALVILLCRDKQNRGEFISDFTGLARVQPYAAMAMVLFFLSLTGIPPTGGFVAKFYIFAAAIREGFVWLAIIGVANSAISLYYYFRVVMAMYMREPEKTVSFSYSPALTVAILVMAIGTLLIGVYPHPFLSAAKTAVTPLLGSVKAMAMLP
ncbi:MAG: NADH-quinone oxidoreductase subunit N [Nitrospinota bacterium]|nr:MAG: NADH-quinone oxidoreductase subunit N [Nitrospinota bacterium]